MNITKQEQNSVGKGVNKMKNIGIDFWIQIVIYGVSFGTLWGTLQTRLKYMEQKLDKHNNLVERMYVVEERCKSNTHRIDELKGDQL